MFWGSLILAFCASIDSIGIGISYGIKNTKISLPSYLLLFLVSLLISTLSILFGNILSSILPNFISNSIGSILLFFMGFYIIYKSMAQYDADFDKSNDINLNEALFLSLALSIDTIGIGIGGGNMGFNICLFPIFVSIFQILFLFIGIIFGNKITNISNIPDTIWSLLSGGLLIFISILNITI